MVWGLLGFFWVGALCINIKELPWEKNGAPLQAGNNTVKPTQDVENSDFALSQTISQLAISLRSGRQTFNIM